jgi:L-amino acid N-acyltransferase YncA
VIAAIYNEGIADHTATFETEPRSAGQIAEWFSGRRLVIVAETEKEGPVAFAASFPHSDRLAIAASASSRCMCGVIIAATARAARPLPR